MKNKNTPQLKGQAAVNKNTFDSYSTVYIKQFRRAVLSMTIFPVLILTLSAGVFLTSLKGNGTEAAAGFAPTPTQPAGFFYNSDPPASWAKPGALVVCGRDNCGNQAFRNVSAQGGTVLVYIDTIVNEPSGKYHALYMNAGACGGKVELWPGGGVFNNSNNKLRYVNDVRVGSVAQQKLSCVLESIVRDNPHIGGFFADDLGGDNGYTQAKLPKEEYYQAAVALSKTFRSVADKYNLMFIPNGGWEGGSHNAGYPNRSTPGNALADGSCVEHHSAGELSYWTTYLRSTQWAAQSSTTKGTPFHIIITEPVDFTAYRTPNFNGFIANQHDYANAGTPWGNFHPTGLPNKVSGTTGTTPTPSTPTPTTPPPTPPTPTPAPVPTAKPATPTGLKLTPGENKITVTWNASPVSEKVDTYQVYLNGAYAYTNTTSPSYTITGTPGQTFSVRVSAHNSAGYGPWTASMSAVVGSAPGTPAPTPTPLPPAPTPLPPISVPGANSTKPVAIPVNLPVASDGTVIADFTGDGLNEVAQDLNKDGQIDPTTEIVIDGVNNQELTDKSQLAVSSEQLYAAVNQAPGEIQEQPSNDSNISFKAGILPQVTIPKTLAYTFMTTQAVVISGFGAYFAVTKLSVLASFRGRIGL